MAAKTGFPLIHYTSPLSFLIGRDSSFFQSLCHFLKKWRAASVLYRCNPCRALTQATAAQYTNILLSKAAFPKPFSRAL